MCVNICIYVYNIYIYICMYMCTYLAMLLTFNEELANGDLEVLEKLVEVQKDARGNPPA